MTDIVKRALDAAFAAGEAQADGVRGLELASLVAEMDEAEAALRATNAGGAPTPATLRAPINAEFVARRFHHWYETFAPKFGYTTRRETACPFDALPSANRDLMVATCEAVVRDIAPLFAAQESTQTTLRAPAIDSLEALRANIEFVEANDPDFEHATFVVSHGVAQTMCSVATVYADEVKAYLERHSVTETTGRASGDPK